MTSGHPILEVSNLNVDFFVNDTWNPAVVDMNFELAAGETLAIVGESGSGKSTTALALASLLAGNAKVEGSVKLAGQELIGLSNKQLRSIRGKQIAYIFQEPMTALNPLYTIGYQIVETLQAHFAISTKDARQKAIELLAAVELPDPEVVFGKYPHQLSGGQRQRALIAQAISCEPEILIADEPTTALDVTVQADILDLMRRLRSERQMAVLLITHDMGVVADFADRVLVMKDGREVESAEIRSLFKTPKQTYTRELLDAVPKLGNTNNARSLKLVGEPVLKVQSATVEYAKAGKTAAFEAATDVSFEIYAGETLGLVGESGSGKTTIGRAIVGLLPIKSGAISIDGHAVVSASKRTPNEVRSARGIVFQDPNSSLNPRLSIGQSIAEGPYLAKIAAGAELETLVKNLLDQVELPREFINRYPHELSGGQRQRVGIARALALNPRLLVADEPTSALDVSVQARFLQLLQELQSKLNFACLFISHDLAVVDILANRIAVIQNGQIVEIGSNDQILRNPQQAYTQRLVSCVPYPDPDVQLERRTARSKAAI